MKTGTQTIPFLFTMVIHIFGPFRQFHRKFREIIQLIACDNWWSHRFIYTQRKNGWMATRRRKKELMNVIIRNMDNEWLIVQWTLFTVLGALFYIDHFVRITTIFLEHCDSFKELIIQWDIDDDWILNHWLAHAKRVVIKERLSTTTI